MNVSGMAVLCGVAALLSGAALWLAPGPARAGLERFPRSRWAGWILAAVDLAWVAWIVSHASLGGFEYLKPFVLPATPVAIVLVAWFMDELLAPRALGGLLLLLADPVLDTLRWHASDWRLTVTSFMYLLIAAGIVLVWSPFWFRRTAAALFRQPALPRWTGLMLFVLAAVFFLSAWQVGRAA